MSNVIPLSVDFHSTAVACASCSYYEVVLYSEHLYTHGSQAFIVKKLQEKQDIHRMIHGAHIT